MCFSLVEALDSEAAELYDIGFLFAAVVRSPCTGALEGADEARGLDGRDEGVELVARDGLADDGVVGARSDVRGGVRGDGGGSAVSLVVEQSPSSSSPLSSSTSSSSRELFLRDLVICFDCFDCLGAPPATRFLPAFLAPGFFFCDLPRVRVRPFALWPASLPLPVRLPPFAASSRLRVHA